MNGNRIAGPMRGDTRQNISVVSAGRVYRSQRDNIDSASGAVRLSLVQCLEIS